MIKRKIQVYDFVLNTLLFEVNIPNSNSVKSCIYCRFVDQDNLLAIQDGTQRVTLINIMSYAENFNFNVRNNEVQEKTMKIEGPITIDVDFNEDNEKMEAQKKHQNNMSDDSENMNTSNKSKAFIDYDGHIEKIFTSRNTSVLGYIAIVSQYRFTIYNLYDDQQGSVDMHQEWDHDIRFEQSHRIDGKIITLDFDKNC